MLEMAACRTAFSSIQQLTFKESVSNSYGDWNCNNRNVAWISNLLRAKSSSPKMWIRRSEACLIGLFRFTLVSRTKSVSSDTSDGGVLDFL